MLEQRKNNPIIWQFLGDKLDGQLFDKSFKILEEYNNSEYKDKFELYNKAENILDNIIELSNEVGTKYSIEYIAKTSTKTSKKTSIRQAKHD